MEKGIIGNDLLLYGDYLYDWKMSIFDYVVVDGFVIFEEYLCLFDSE